VSLLAGPGAYAVTSIRQGTAGALAAAGPSGELAGGPPEGAAGRTQPPRFGRGRTFPGAGARGGAGAGTPGGGAGGASVDRSLVRYLDAHRDGAEYLLAVEGSQSAAPNILATGDPVMAMGGFTGSDPWPTLSAFERLVGEGKVHYVLLAGGSSAAGGGLGAGGGNSAVSVVEKWVERHGAVVPSRDIGGASGGTLYEVGVSSAR
jgi:hypothetical protein